MWNFRRARSDSWPDCAEVIHWTRVALTLMVGATLLCSCSSRSDDGPLSFGAESGVACGTLPRFAEAAFGINIPSDISDELIIEGAVARGAKGVTIEGLYLMPVSAEYRLLLEQYPPTEQFGREWASAIDAVGATVRQGEVVDLVVHVTTEGQMGGEFASLEILYSSPEGEFVTHYPIGLNLSRTGCD